VQQRDLRCIELLAAEIRRIDRMRVDQDRTQARATQHDRGGRAGQPAADDRNIGFYRPRHEAASRSVSSMRPKA